MTGPASRAVEAPAGAPPRRRRLSADGAMIAMLVVVVGYVILPPLVMLIYGAITDTGPAVDPNYTTDTLARAYGRGTIYPALGNSVLYAACTATLVLVIGGFLAWLVERTDSSVRRYTDLFALAPIVMPAVLLISGWILLLGPRNGLINLLAMEYLGAEGPLFDLFSFWGMVWVGMLQGAAVGFPVAVAGVSFHESRSRGGGTGGRGRDADRAPAHHAADAQAHHIRRLDHLLHLLARPAHGAAADRVAGGHLPVLDRDLPRLPAHAHRPQPGERIQPVVLAVTVAGIYAYRRATREADRFVTITGRGYNPRLIRLGKWQIVVTLVAVFLLLCVAGLPMLVLVWNAFMPYPQVPSLESLSLFTTRNFGRALDYGPAVRAVGNSIVLGIAAGLVSTVIGALIAWANLRGRTHRRTIAVLDQLAMAPLAIPGIIIGVGLLWLYLVLPVPIYGTHWILLLAYVAIHLPFAVRICTSGLAQLHPELEEAGLVAGASRATVLRRIVFLLIMPSILASILYVGLRAFREYAASIFLSAPGTEVFSVIVLDMWEGGNSNILSAYVTMVMVLLGVAMYGFFALSRRVGIKV
ncbi:MAG: ABC transporter permease subunit [Gammaproteobacteria bacterium]|nr:ABC transporter permease subunit [Gammaproteobacteria bacterium]